MGWCMTEAVVTRGRKKKVQDNVLAEAYARLGSCWKVGEEVGIRGSSVHERLVKMGIAKPMNVFSDDEKAVLVVRYQTFADSGTIDVLAKEMGRTKQFICRQAKELGLTDPSRQKPYIAETTSIRMKDWIKANGHPKGATGMKHTDEAKAAIGKASALQWAAITPEKLLARNMKSMKTRVENGTPFNERPQATWKAAWREIGGTRKYYRSKWEANYAHYLEWMKQKGEILSWKHEPKTFWFDGVKRGTVSYLPDFCVVDMAGNEAYHEVKGWMDDRSKTKIKRMKKYHPKVKLIVVDAKAYNALKKAVSGCVPGWEL